MAEAEKVETQEVTLKNVGRAPYVIIDAEGVQHPINPGVERKVTVPKAQADRFKKTAEKGGGGLSVDGTDPREVRAAPAEGAPEVPSEHDNRTAMAAKEAELMAAGQEADKDAREKRAEKDWQALAGETGIG